MATYNKRIHRTGGIYVAVLGTSLIAALLGMAALMGQRIQNRMMVSVADIRQAQLNANTAIELALWNMKNDANWRSTNSNGVWFTQRALDVGSCTASVTDPVDSNLANSADEPVVVLGIGYSGNAEQRAEVVIDPRKKPVSSLRSAVATGDEIDLAGDTLRAAGLITANSTTANASQVHGTVEAVTISGSTYTGTTTQIPPGKRPAMPDWASVFNYYRTNGAQLSFASLPTSTPNLGRNVGIESGTTDWFEFPNNVNIDLEQANSPKHSGSYSMEVKFR
jgi:hypothetical protein